MLWTLLAWGLGLLFLFAGGTKLLGMQMHVDHFTEWGYPQWFRLVVGAWEAASGAALFVPRLRFAAAVALAVGMMGAIYTELFRGASSMAVAPAVLLSLLLIVAYRTYRRR